MDRPTPGLRSEGEIPHFLIPILLMVGLVVLSTCANQGFPSGGPVDKTPPAVVRTVPEQSSTRVPLSTDVEITFSERVDHNSCVASLFITPFPAQGVHTSWRGRTLRLRVIDGLLPDRTYVVTIGTTTRDYRNNALPQSFTLSFSTGDHLDTGEISGRIFSDTRLAGTQLWAYDLSENPDPDPAAIKPIYITQAGENGFFRLSNLGLRPFRVFAVYDREANGLYDPETDALGVPHRDVQLDSLCTSYEHLNFRVARRDTTPPVLLSATAADDHHVDLRFSEPLKIDGLDQMDNYHLTSDSSRRSAALVYGDLRNPSFVHLVVDQPLAEKSWRIAVRSAQDLAGLPLDPQRNSAEFVGRAVPDTIGPRILDVQPPDSARLVDLQTPIRILFSEAMQRDGVERIFVLADSNAQSVKGRLSWQSPAVLVFQSDSLLQGNMRYCLTAQVDSVFDYFGNPLQDSVFCHVFFTVNPDTFSIISGTIVDEDSTRTGPFVISAQELKGQAREIRVDSAGPYAVGNLFPGAYRIQVYRDSDRNGVYSLGQHWPFLPAERFFVYADSVQLRSRWPNEGNEIRLPR